MKDSTFKIRLNKGKHAIVSKKDYERVIKYKWHFNKNGYAVRNVKRGSGEETYMHRIIMEEHLTEGLLVDHKNGNGLDNRRENLRVCTKTQNQQNQKPRHTSVSKYKGVGYYKRDKKWRARIISNKKDIELGKFEDEKEAALAYDKAAEKYHGEYSWLNRDNFDEIKALYEVEEEGIA